ncbi:serine/threonine-protein phosphatase 6 regulatory ankyrin repeat subunit B-like [Neocloeon triangulifer]|uniref:serine/threonine-protein phosphatase 6 regulatory ankyrin repeat subunit B-like n=1 Tax=Neocloeon triangulifer TaxID=2078957 RepID=UPI00286EC3DE|nr:serine/threonine-protein phosphatase 6 regulatory ankyrin repeat subunit B-like [Neocloeon triangulifer]XP_059472031.1 serine/threonine-protein phosphatase 6 regulatory ankyrin repeat subunit B-like [Neocloeon triangulifer]
MASVDSGVETENDSNDSSQENNRRSMDQSPASSLRDSRSASENSFFSGRDPVPSTSQQPDGGASSSKQQTQSKPGGDLVASLEVDLENLNQLKEKFRLICSTFSNSAAPRRNFAADNGNGSSSSLWEAPSLFTSEPVFHAENSEMLEIEPPAGLAFENLRPRNGALTNGQGYEVSNDTAFSRRLDGQNRFKAIRRIYRNQSRQARQALIEPLTVFYERNLRRAVSANNIETVETLLNSGVNPNACDEFKRAPLHLAACRGFIQILQLLLDKGANPNQKDSMGNTALHLAACTNNVPVVTLLLKAGTDVCSLDQYGRNPLQLAQTRLKMLQATAASNPDAMQVKSEVQNVIDMMQIYLHRIGSQNRDAENELLNSFSTRLTLSQTSQEVDHELRGLLASLSNLNISKTPGKGGLESIDV